MNSYVYFDYCALIVEALIIISLIIRKMTRGRVNRWALVLIADIVISTAADLAGHILENMGPGHTVWKYVTNALTLLGTTYTSVIFCGYLFAMIGIWYRVNENRVLAAIYNVPIIIITALVVVINPFTRIVYYIDDNGVYQRGPVFYVLYAIAYMYVVVSYIQIIK